MFKNALIGFIVAILCTVPPLIHFISGPLGPFIGGWIAGSRSKASPEQSLTIGVLMGALVLGPVLLIAKFGSSISPIEDLNMDTTLGLFIGLGITFYVAILGAIGSAIAGHMANKSESTD